MERNENYGCEQKRVTVNDKEYTLQNIPLRLVYEMQERAKDKNGNTRPSVLYDEIFKKVIVSPKVSWDDFESADELEELMGEVLPFLMRRKQQA